MFVSTVTQRTKRSIILKSIVKTDPLIPTIMDFLWMNFYLQEPLNKATRLAIPGYDIKFMDYFCASALDSGTCAIAQDAISEKIVSVKLNNLEERCPNGENRQKFESGDNQLNMPASHLKFFEAIENCKKELALFDQYPHVDRILEQFVASTAPDWTSDGLYKLLVEFSRDNIAKDIGCGLMYAVCTSYYTSKALGELGYKQIWRQKFADIMDKCEIDFNTEPPHDYVTIMSMDLSTSFYIKPPINAISMRL